MRTANMNKGTAEGEKQMTVAEAIREYVNETAEVDEQGSEAAHMNKGTAEGEKQMTVAEAIREYVNETEGLEFYGAGGRKTVMGILVKGDNSYIRRRS